MRYQPGHPMANKEGYVLYPNVNIVGNGGYAFGLRGFQTNVEVMNTAKTMLQRVLTLGQYWALMSTISSATSVADLLPQYAVERGQKRLPGIGG